MNIVLDTARIRFIIYIWYEDGHIRPSLVKLNTVELSLPLRGRLPEAWSADIE